MKINRIIVPLGLLLLVCGCATRLNLSSTPPQKWSLEYWVLSEPDGVQSSGKLSQSGELWLHKQSSSESDDPGTISVSTNLPSEVTTQIYRQAVLCAGQFRFADNPDHMVDGISARFTLVVRNRSCGFGYHHFLPGVDYDRVPEEMHELYRLLDSNLPHLK